MRGTVPRLSGAGKPVAVGLIGGRLLKYARNHLAQSKSNAIERFQGRIAVAAGFQFGKGRRLFFPRGRVYGGPPLDLAAQRGAGSTLEGFV